MRIAVLGGGNGSYAAAVDLAEQGHALRLWRRDAAAFAPVLESGRLWLKDFQGRREVRIELATTSLADALADAALILAPVPAFAQRDLARAMAPHLRDGQVVFLPPGSFGSYVMAAELKAAGNRADVAFAEAGTLPYLTRKHGPAEVAITTRATRLPTGVFPARLAEHAFAVIREAYPAVLPVEDALSAALMNAGPIIHPPLIMMNAGPIEHFDHWDIHNEGTTPSIRRVTTALDGERIALREALGYRPPHFPLADHYESDVGCMAISPMTSSSAAAIGASASISCGTVICARTWRWASPSWSRSPTGRGVPAPVARGLLAIGSAMTGEDFTQSPRTLGALGLARLDPGGLARLLQDGVA